MPKRRKLNISAAEMAVINAKPNLSVPEAALLAGLHSATLYREWLAGRGPQYMTVGTRRIISRKALDKWLSEQVAA
jgi:excisionase family DNA binding protein